MGGGCWWRGCYGEPRSEQLTRAWRPSPVKRRRLERRSRGGVPVWGLGWRSDTSSSKSNTRTNTFTLMSPPPSSFHSTRNVFFVSFASYSHYPLFPFSFSVRPSVFIFYSVVSSPHPHPHYLSLPPPRFPPTLSALPRPWGTIRGAAANPCISFPIPGPAGLWRGGDEGTFPL